MEFPLTEFNQRDLHRELYGYSLGSEGTKQQLIERLITARHEQAEAQAQGLLRPGRPPISKHGACVQPDDFTEIETMSEEEYTAFLLKVNWRLQRVLKTSNRKELEFYNPAVLHQIDRSKTYVLNMSEFWVRQKPYIHKIFVIFVSRTNGENQSLCYARSHAKLRSENLNLDEIKATITTSENIGRALSNILLEIEDNGLENYVAIITDRNSVSLKALSEVSELHGEQKLPHIVLDDCQLHKSFQNLFCAKSARCLCQVKNELFEKSTYEEQLRKLQENYTQNIDAECLIQEYFASLPKVLQAMWKIDEHRDKTISLTRLNNDRLNAYCAQVQNDLPPITFEECSSGAGLIQLVLFDALWCLCDDPEAEEENKDSTPELPVPEDWMSILN